MTAKHLKDHCANCGAIHPLDDGLFSIKWHPGKFMCATCLGDEAWEIDYPGEQPKFPKNMPLRQCRTKNMQPSDTVRWVPNL